jgi:hypothetical protein
MHDSSKIAIPVRFGVGVSSQLSVTDKHLTFTGVRMADAQKIAQWIVDSWAVQIEHFGNDLNLEKIYNSLFITISYLEYPIPKWHISNFCHYKGVRPMMIPTKSGVEFFDSKEEAVEVANEISEMMNRKRIEICE